MHTFLMLNICLENNFTTCKRIQDANCKVVHSLLGWLWQHAFLTNGVTNICKQNRHNVNTMNTLRQTLPTRSSPTRTFCNFKSPCTTGCGCMECKYSIPRTIPRARNSFCLRSIWNEIQRLHHKIHNCSRTAAKQGRQYRQNQYHHH